VSATASKSDNVVVFGIQTREQLNPERGEAGDMKPGKQIQRDGSIDPACYDFVDGELEQLSND